MRASIELGSVRLRYLAVALLLSMVLVIAACGGGDDQDDASEQSRSGVTEPDNDGAETEQSEDGTVSVQNPDADEQAEDEQSPPGDPSQAGSEPTVRNGIEIISLEGEGEGDPAADSDSVGVRYRGTLDDGTEFDSNIGGQLFPVTIGAGGVIVGFDEALRGLRLGETITVRIPAELAYGVSDEALIFEFPRGDAPPGIMEGQAVQLGNGIRATVVEVTDEIVRLDGNHELADEALTFEISIEKFQ